MSTFRRKNTSSAVRLMQLMDTQLSAIAKTEQGNANAMRLYDTGDYWAAFDHSAYQLKKLFPELVAFVVSHPHCPFTVVGVSIPDEQLRSYDRLHLSRKSAAGYKEFAVETLDNALYRQWHSEEIKTFQTNMAEAFAAH